MKHKKKFTPEQLRLLEQMSALRLPMEQMAILLETDVRTLERKYKTTNAVRAAIDGGRARAGHSVRGRLFQMAMGREPKYLKDAKGTVVFDKKGNPIVVEPGQEPDFKAMKFWCQTQEGFKITNGLELMNPDGSPLKTMSNADIDARVDAIMKRAEARKDKGGSSGGPVGSDQG